MRSSAIVCLFVIVALLASSVTPTFARRTETTHAIQVQAGWNLLSLPASVSNGSKDSLFPMSVSSAYIFRNQVGYITQDTLTHGIGFWLKFTEEDTVYIEGSVIFADTIDVQAGWNLIGALSMPVAVGAIQTEPPGILSSQFFSYTPGAGYDDVDTLRPAHGYWVKVSQDGLLILKGAGIPCPGTPTVTYAGKTYNTVQIGSQCWLRENLDVGIRIDGIQEQTNNSTIEKYCYNNNPANCDSYGGLYQWNEAMQYDTTQGGQGICPPGWHIPTLAEFRTLRNTVGGDGNALKEIGQGTGGGAGTNTSGFSALLAGFRLDDGYFYDLGYNGTFWSSTQNTATYTRSLNLTNYDAGLYLNSLNKYNGFSVRCVMDETPNLPPNVPSNPIPDSGGINVWTSPTLRWSCSDPEDDPLTYDVYFGTDNPPVTLVSSNQSDTNLTRIGLIRGTTYYWKVVAKDNHGNSTDGPVWSYTTKNGGGEPCPGTPTVTYAGKTYNTVQIGSQCWLRENLDVGIRIDGIQEQTNNSTIEKYCYNNNPANCDSYGGLYQWNEAMQYDTTAGVQGICPPGWRIPTLAEFQTLIATVGGDGNALKAIGQGIGAGAGTNTSGFSALLAGLRYYDGAFSYLGTNGTFWSSSENTAASAHGLSLVDYGALVSLGYGYKYYGFSVRCIKDDETNLPPNVPSNPIPDSGGINVWTSPTLRWSCSDPEDDPLTYDVYFGTDNPPVTLVSSNQSDTNLTRTGLISGTTYYWKVVAKDNHGNLTDGPVWSYTTQNGGGSPCPGIPTVTYAGKTYNTVQIGTQCWLRENLNVGMIIPGTQEQTNNSIIEKYCYNDSLINCDTYGGLYQWNEAMQYSTTPGAQGICPPGWHLPTLAQFETLDVVVGWDGNALKAIGQGTGTNTSGFSALLAGYRNSDGSFGSLSGSGVFWSSTELGASHAHYLALGVNNPSVYLGFDNEYLGFSVRCLKNEGPNQPPGVLSSPVPEDEAANVSISPALSWSCSLNNHHI